VCVQALDLLPASGLFCIFSIATGSGPTSGTIAAGTNDNSVYLYDLETKRRMDHIARAHFDDVNSVCFDSRNGDILYSASDDGICKVWDLRCAVSSQAVGYLIGHRAGLTHVEGKGDGVMVLTNSKDQSVRMWDLRKMDTERVHVPLREHVETKWDYRFETAPSNDMSVKVFEGNVEQELSRGCVAAFYGHSVLQTLVKAHFSPRRTTGRRFIYTGSSTGDVCIYDTHLLEAHDVFRAHTGVVRDCAWHPHVPMLITTSWDCTIGFWSCERAPFCGSPPSGRRIM